MPPPGRFFGPPRSSGAFLGSNIVKSDEGSAGSPDSDEFGYGSVGILADGGLTKGRITSQLTPYRLQIQWPIPPSGTGAPNQWDWFEVVLT